MGRLRIIIHLILTLGFVALAVYAAYDDEETIYRGMTSITCLLLAMSNCSSLFDDITNAHGGKGR